MGAGANIWRWSWLGSLALMLVALAPTAAQACRYSPLPDPGRIAEADVVVLAALMRREPGPAVVRTDGVASGESELLTFHTLKTFQGEERAEWTVLWPNTPHSPLKTPAYFFAPATGVNYIAAINVDPIDDRSERVIILSESEEKTFPQVLQFDSCSGGAAYLFPPHKVRMTEAGWEWVK